MAKVTEKCFEESGRPCFICDFSPPRSGDGLVLQNADIPADFISIAYNPGRAVRVNSAMLAAAIKQHSGMDTIFTLATRDMNKLALQSQMLGAQVLDLENVVVVQGDPFGQRDQGVVKEVGDTHPTQFIAALRAMNQGIDFRGSQLRSPTSFCIGATADLGRDTDQEAALAVRKVEAGAEFFMTQPIFDVAEADKFLDSYRSKSGKYLSVPVFYGLQIMEKDGVIFSSVPESVREELEKGRSGVEIALELYRRFREHGLNNAYLMPPIRRGGARNYEAAQQVLAASKSL
jgi:homocysteine S-methyltransferase